MKLQLLVALVGALFVFSTAIDLLDSDAELLLLDSQSAIPIAAFVGNPELADALQAQTEGCFNSEYLVVGNNKFVIQGYENLYPAFAGNPLFVAYNVSADTLVETSRIVCPTLVTSTNAIVSPNSALRYVGYGSAIPVYPGLPVEEVAFVPQDYVLFLFQYDLHGVFNQTPVVSFQLSSLSNNLYNQSIAYNGFAGVSNDGLYVVATYALGSEPEVITGQKLDVLKVHATSAGAVTGLSSAAKTNTAPTGIPGLYSFPQGLEMWQDAWNTSLYHLIVAENSWNFPFITGLTSQISYYQFVTSGSFERIVSQEVQGYIQGFGVDTVNNLVYTITPLTVPVGSPSVEQTPNTPWENGAPDPQNNLRVYRLSTSAGTLTYLGGLNLQQDGVQVRPSNDGSLIAVTTGSVTADDIFNTTYDALGTAANHYAPNEVTVYSVLGNNNLRLRLESQSAASPLSFCLAWSPDDSRLAVGGEPTYRNNTANFLFTGQQNVQLYNVEC